MRKAKVRTVVSAPTIIYMVQARGHLFHMLDKFAAPLAHLSPC
jgi:hypothetical protein